MNSEEKPITLCKGHVNRSLRGGQGVRKASGENRERDKAFNKIVRELTKASPVLYL